MHLTQSIKHMVKIPQAKKHSREHQTHERERQLRGGRTSHSIHGNEHKQHGSGVFVLMSGGEQHAQ